MSYCIAILPARLLGSEIAASKMQSNCRVFWAVCWGEMRKLRSLK